MPSVYLGRFNRWIEKLLNVKGGPTVVDIMPGVTVVKSLDTEVEERYLQTWYRFGAFLTAPAVAALQSSVRLRNPASSNVIAVIEQICMAQAGAVATKSTLTVSISNGLADLAGGTTVPLRLDFRQSGGSTLHVSQGTSAVSGGVMVGALSGNSIQFIQTRNQELVIMPGDAYEVLNSTVNEGINVSFIWRERGLESSELT